MARKPPSLKRMQADPEYAQRRYTEAYGPKRKPLADLSPAYRDRMLRSLAAGKTASEARGHAPSNGVSEYEVRKSRLMADYGVNAGQYTTLRRLAQDTETPWVAVQTALNRNLSPREVIKLLRDKKDSRAARKRGDRGPGHARWFSPDRVQRAPVEFYYYN